MDHKRFVGIIRKDMDCSLRLHYSKKSHLSIRNRYRHLSETFRDILSLAEEHFYDEAQAYVETRDKQNAGKLEKNQQEALDEIKTCINETDCLSMHKIKYEIIPASSFSAGTYLIGDSDIDFAVVVKKIDPHKVACVSNALGQCQFIYNDLRNKDNPRHTHWVFQKYIDNVEIEAKVRDMDGFRQILKMHTYLDNEMPQKDRVLITYIKYLLKQMNKKAYERFKMFYYCHGGYMGKCRELMYDLR